MWLVLCLPDFSPIEQCWSKIKIRLQAVKARIREDLEKVLAGAIKLSRRRISTASSSTVAIRSHPYECRCNATPFVDDDALSSCYAASRAPRKPNSSAAAPKAVSTCPT